MSPPALVIFYESPFCFGRIFLGRYHRAKMIFDQVIYGQKLWNCIAALCVFTIPLLSLHTTRVRNLLSA